MNQLESTIQNLAPAVTRVDENFLPSLYRTTLVWGLLIAVGVGIFTQSLIWAGSLFFGVGTSLIFLKAQEVFLKRMLASRVPNPASTKTPKSVWGAMVGKYILLAAVMAGALHFNVLNLIAFVLGFALLHIVMLCKLLFQRGRASNQSRVITADSAQHGGMKA